jgi:hypothetical protein
MASSLTIMGDKTINVEIDANILMSRFLDLRTHTTLIGTIAITCQARNAKYGFIEVSSKRLLLIDIDHSKLKIKGNYSAVSYPQLRVRDE